MFENNRNIVRGFLIGIGIDIIGLIYLIYAGFMDNDSNDVLPILFAIVFIYLGGIVWIPIITTVIGILSQPKQ